MLNKKTYIRLFALVMALLMTVAVFAGCNNQEAIDEANANAQAAQNAADEAKKAADSLAQAAKDLADQLSAAQDKINEQDQAIKDAQAEASKAQDAANNAQNGVDSWHDPANTTAPAVTEPAISQKPWDEYTESANLKAFTDLKNKYLILIADWYTAENYAALNKIFEDAAFEIYRAVDGTGLEQIINDASTKAAQVDSIASDAAKVQALIAAFGDVQTEIFTADKPEVEAAREAFNAWVAKYEKCFFVKNGYNLRDNAGNLVTTGTTADGTLVERAIVDFAKKQTNNALDIAVSSGYNSLLYAEAKIKALEDYAIDAIKAEMVAQFVISNNWDAAKFPTLADQVKEAKQIVDILFKEGATQAQINTALAQYKSVLAIIALNDVTYAQCKKNGQLIEDAYTMYKIFWNANNADDTPIAGAAGEELLSGLEFVQIYVHTLYNGELALYENTVRDYLYNQVVEFFLNSGNTSTIKDDTGWALNVNASYLNANGEADLVYAANGAEVIAGLNTPVTFAVEFDKIDVYVNGVKDDELSIPADGVQIERALNRCAAAFATKIFAYDYVEDFKGHTTLEDAFVVIDQFIVEAIIDMTAVYYDEVVKPYLTYQLALATKGLEDKYVSEETDYYSVQNNKFNANAAKLVTLAQKQVNSFEPATKEALNAIYDEDKKIENIEDQQMFIVNYDDQGTLNIDPLTTPISLYKDSNSAMKTVVEYFNNGMEDLCMDLYTRIVDLEDAKAFHAEKIAVAQKLDKLVGSDLEFDSKGKIKNTAKTGVLMNDYADEASKVLGDAYTDKLIYTAIDAARVAARDAIMAVEYMNYDEGTPLFTFATYQAVDKDGNALYYTDAARDAAVIKKAADKNKVLNVIVDRDVVANNELYELFADGADSVLKAFADLVRPQIQANVTVGIELYEKNYSFGNLDPVGVYLENDMREYIDYLNSLTGLAAIDAYKTTAFSLLNKVMVVDGKYDDLETEGYKLQTVGEDKNHDYLAHVYKFDATLDEITGIGATADKGWYDKLAKEQLDAFFALTSEVAYTGLEDVRKLAYIKDNLINGTVATKVNGTEYNSMPVILASIKGDWNATTGTWTSAPKYAYDMSAKRTELYLTRLDEVYNDLCGDIAAITVLSAKSLAKAEEQIEKILIQAENDNVAYDETDDKSLAIVYTRYYLIGEYEWLKYNNNIKK